MQRAGSGLNVNLHFHTLVLDGVFTEAPGGALALAMIRHRVQRLLVRRGLEPSDDAPGSADPLADESPIMAGIVGASVQGRVALGSRAGARVRRLGEARDTAAVTSREPRQAHLDGFDLHANVWGLGERSSGGGAFVPIRLAAALCAGPVATAGGRETRREARAKGIAG